MTAEFPIFLFFSDSASTKKDLPPAKKRVMLSNAAFRYKRFIEKFERASRLCPDVKTLWLQTDQLYAHNRLSNPPALRIVSIDPLNMALNIANGSIRCALLVDADHSTDDWQVGYTPDAPFENTVITIISAKSPELPESADGKMDSHAYSAIYEHIKLILQIAERVGLLVIGDWAINSGYAASEIAAMWRRAAPYYETSIVFAFPNPEIRAVFRDSAIEYEYRRQYHCAAAQSNFNGQANLRKSS